VALSTAESELYALSLCIVELIGLMRLLHDLGLAFATPVVHCDSQAAMEILRNEHMRSRLRHVDIRKCFIRECMERGDFILQYVNTTMNWADGLTKPLGSNILGNHIAHLSQELDAHMA
jgi:hypothetical protein